MANSYYSDFPRLRNQRDVVMMYSIKKYFIYATNMAAGFASQASMFLQVENKIKEIRHKVKERILVIQQKGVSELNQICAPLGIQVSKDSGYNEIEKAVLNKIQEIFKKNGEVITEEVRNRFETFRSLKEISRFKSGQKLFNMSESTKTLKPLIKSLETAYKEGAITADELKSQLRVALQNAIDAGVNEYLNDSLRKIIEMDARKKHDSDVASFSEKTVDELIERIVNDKRGVVSIMNKFNHNMQTLFSKYFKVFTSKEEPHTVSPLKNHLYLLPLLNTYVSKVRLVSIFLPIPSATQSSGLSATRTFIPVSVAINLSRFLSCSIKFSSILSMSIKNKTESDLKLVTKLFGIQLINIRP